MIHATKKEKMPTMSTKTYDANVRVKELEVDVDETLNDIASRRGLYKWEIVREALREYAKNHGS